MTTSLPLPTTFKSESIYRVEFKEIAMSIYRNFAGLDIISDNAEIAQELFNIVFDAMEKGVSFDEAVRTSEATIVA